MKKNNIIIFLVIIITFCMGSILVIQNVKADSGWDSSYDSGGSDWGSSDYGSSSYDYGSSSYRDSNRNYDSSTSSNSNFYLVYILLLMLSSIVILILKEKHKNQMQKEKVLPNRIFQELANSIISNFNIEKFENVAYDIFYNVQMAWMKFDYDKLKELVTDELYNTYVMDLETLKLKQYQNIMKNFKLNKIELTNLQKNQEGFFTATVYLDVEFYDYVISTKSNMIMRGTDRRKINNVYKLTFIKKENNIVKDKICPSCGAPAKGNATGVCEYCKSKLVNDNFDWVMSNKERI